MSFRLKDQGCFRLCLGVREEERHLSVLQFSSLPPKKSGNSGKLGNFSLPTEFLPDSGQSGVVFYRVFRQKMPLSLGLKVFICLFTGGWQEFCRLMFPDSDRGKIGERLFYVPERGTGGPRKNLGGGWGWNNPQRKIEKPFYSTKKYSEKIAKAWKKWYN